ncbi:MAG: hypothetical protein AMJ66_07515, partial [Betaproteobacteria bacterium SG8_40]
MRAGTRKPAGLAVRRHEPWAAPALANGLTPKASNSIFFGTRYMDISVRGLRVLITAGAGGIGRAMTEVFFKAGARVHICDVVQASIDETKAAFPGVTGCLADVSKLGDVDRLFADVQSNLGGLDCLINNAG